jgi:hypothetical protein
MRDECKSEVARLLRQIDAEYEAAKRALTDFSITARHDFIEARMENIAICHLELAQLVGTPEQAMALMAETTMNKSENGSAYYKN